MIKFSFLFFVFPAFLLSCSTPDQESCPIWLADSSAVGMSKLAAQRALCPEATTPSFTCKNSRKSMALIAAATGSVTSYVAEVGEEAIVVECGTPATSDPDTHEACVTKLTMRVMGDYMEEVCPLFMGQSDILAAFAI